MKSLRYKKKKQHPLAVALCLLFLSFAAFVVVKNASAVELNGQADFRLSLQLSDDACTKQVGVARTTPWLNSIAFNSALFSDWATDTSNYDPDCARLRVEYQSGNAPATSGKDFRVCVQLSDYASTRDGQTVTGGVGLERCTPFVSEGGGWSSWARDSNSYDFDAARVRIQESQTPLQGIEVDDVRFAIQLSDDGCSKGFGPVKTTPWFSAMVLDPFQEHWTDWAHDSNKYDPDCMRIRMDVITGPVGGTGSEDEELPDAPACSDGVDNDSDGSSDYPNDSGCTSADDNSEADNTLNACENGEDDDGDGLVDMNDPGCASPSDDDETDPIACNFAANPTSLVKGIGTSRLTWDCRHSDGTVMAGNVSIVDDNTAQEFTGLGNNLGAAGSVNVAPEQTTRFTLSPSISGLIPETATVRIENSSFDEDIP